jgi:hypothetical protein
MDAAVARRAAAQFARPCALHVDARAPVAFVAGVVTRAPRALAPLDPLIRLLETRAVVHLALPAMHALVGQLNHNSAHQAHSRWVAQLLARHAPLVLLRYRRAGWMLTLSAHRQTHRRGAW